VGSSRLNRRAAAAAGLITAASFALVAARARTRRTAVPAPAKIGELEDSTSVDGRTTILQLRAGKARTHVGLACPSDCATGRIASDQ